MEVGFRFKLVQSAAAKWEPICMAAWAMYVRKSDMTRTTLNDYSRAGKRSAWTYMLGVLAEAQPHRLAADTCDFDTEYSRAVRYTI